MSETPHITLSFYSFGIIMKKVLEKSTIEYAVDPAEIATLFEGVKTFETGILTPDIIYVSERGTERTIASYREPGKIGIWLEGREDPVRVPMPGLVMIRTTALGGGNHHKIYAVKKRPDLKTPLYHAPIPNIFGNGQVCWGNIASRNLTGNDLKSDWDLFFSTPFGTHGVEGRSKQYRRDIRMKLMELAEKKTRKYAVSDLLETGQTLHDHLKGKR